MNDLNTDLAIRAYAKDRTLVEGILAEQSADHYAITNSQGKTLLLLSDDYLYPQSFGAVGDGVHDDTSAFERMFRNLPNHKAIIPRGIYKITDNLVVNANDESEIDFLDSSELYYTKSTGYPLKYLATVDTETRKTIRNLKIRGLSTNTPSSFSEDGQGGLDASKETFAPYGLAIENPRFVGLNGIALNLHHNYNSHVYNFWSKWCGLGAEAEGTQTSAFFGFTARYGVHGIRNPNGIFNGCMEGNSRSAVVFDAGTPAMNSAIYNTWFENNCSANISGDADIWSHYSGDFTDPDLATTWALGRVHLSLHDCEFRTAYTVALRSNPCWTMAGNFYLYTGGHQHYFQSDRKNFHMHPNSNIRDEAIGNAMMNDPNLGNLFDGTVHHVRYTTETVPA